MNYPSISLVTACFNHANYIAETIESILSQNYPNLQYVVIDDGSQDNSWEIIQRYKDKLHYCERLEGYRESPTIAINQGMAKTNASIMGWLNSDDILMPKSLYTIAQIFQDCPQVNWFTGMSTTINQKSQFINSSFKLTNKYDFLTADFISMQQESTFWRRELWEKAGAKLIEGENSWAFDIDLWTKFFDLTEHYHVNTLIGAFRKSATNKSTNSDNKFKSQVKILLNQWQAKHSSIDRSMYKLSKKLFWPLLNLIPNTKFAQTPYFKKFVYHTLEFNSAQNKWREFTKNPFRKTF